MPNKKLPFFDQFLAFSHVKPSHRSSVQELQGLWHALPGRDSSEPHCGWRVAIIPFCSNVGDIDGVND